MNTKNIIAMAAVAMLGFSAGAENFSSDGFSGTINDAGVIQNLSWKGTKLCNKYLVITGDSKLQGGSDASLRYSQDQLGKGCTTFTKGDDGSLTAVTEFPVKGASGTEYFKLKITTKIAEKEVNTDVAMTRTVPFKFSNMIYRGEAEWLLDMFAGSLCDFISWDGKHKYKKYSVAFDKSNNENGGGSKVNVSGKLGDWLMSVSGGYYSVFCDMRAWGGNSFKVQFVQHKSVTWGGMIDMVDRGQLSFTLRPGEKLDDSIVEKSAAAEKAAAAKAAAEEAMKYKPIVKDFPTRDQMWSFADAGREKTACRERISLNGLWGFVVDNDGAMVKTGAPKAAAVHNFFKVPGAWPSGGKYAQNGMAIYDEKGVDCFGTKIKEVKAAWYVRTVEIPATWAGQKTIMGFKWLPTAVLVYVDGAKAGEVFFPGGEIDLTQKLTPGKHELAFFTAAKLPEKLLAVFDAPDQARTITKKEIDAKGVNGDVYIASEPAEIKIDDVQVRSHVAEGKIEFSVGFEGEGSAQVTAVADIYDGAKKVKSFTSPAKTVRKGKRLEFGGDWKDAKVWDVDCPENVYTLRLTIKANGKAVDEFYGEEFGFREVTLSGRDLLLNGKPLHLRPNYSCMCRSESGVSNEDGEESFKKMRAYGFNFDIDGNYGFGQGDLTDFEFSLRAASKVGMPSVMGLPHPCHYALPNKPLNWQLKGPYENLCRYIVKKLQNIPGLLLWSSTHNQTGYEADQNPEIMTGRDEDVPTGIINWRQRMRENSKAVNKLFTEIDPGRPVYHHESGKNGEFYTLNCYLDWAPIQERSDWLETWQEKGVMPLFIVEWGAPHIASWASYRGDEDGRNIWSSFKTTKWPWIDEYNSAILGEEAFHSNPRKRRWIELNAEKTVGNRDNYYGGFDQVTTTEPDIKKVTAMFLKRNIRDMRYRGITMILPWDLWSTHFGWAEGYRDKKVRPNTLTNLKGFGTIKSDYSYGYLNVGGQIPLLTGEVIIDTYADILGWIGGPDKEFTTVNDTYRIGEKVAKSLLFVNDDRHDREIAYVWKAGAEKGKGTVTVKAGRTAQVPISFTAAKDTTKIEAAFRCTATKWTYKDSFALNIIGAKATASAVKSVALFDPEGTAKPLLKAIGVAFSEVNAAPKSGILVIGRNAYAKLPFDLKAAADAGVKVVMLEQDGAALKKLGFRYQEHGLRQVFANDTFFNGLDTTDWRGVSTSLPWFIGVPKMSGDFPRTKWEGIDVTRVWRAGNRGCVASILPEKPCRGDYHALLSGGFNLQYAPLMEYSANGQRVIFSQLDLCGRLDKRDGAAAIAPEATEMLSKILDYANRPTVKKSAKTYVLEAGNNVATNFGELGIPFVKANAASDAKPGDLLVLGPNAKPGNIAALVKSGVNVVAFGLSGKEVNAAYPAAKATDRAFETYPDYNDAIGKEPLFTGVSNADIQWFYAGCMNNMAKIGESGILAAFHEGKGAFIVSGIAPWRFDAKTLALRHNRRRAQALMTRLVSNLGGTVADAFPGSGAALYADTPIKVDDPYRYFRW